MDFHQFMEWAFLGIISFASLYAVTILAALKKSIDQLNIKIAEVIEKSSWHEKWLTRHDIEIQDLKKK